MCFWLQTRWVRGSPGLSGRRVRSAVAEGSSSALVSAALHPAMASTARARPATPRSASVSPCFPHTPLYNPRRASLSKAQIQFLSVFVCLTLCFLAEVGCPPGRLYRECERGEGCPFSCAQVSGREGCYSDGCEEGCHCPPHTYQHHGLCLQVSSLPSVTSTVS